MAGSLGWAVFGFLAGIKGWCSSSTAHLDPLVPMAGETKLSTSTVAALFSKMALTGQRIAMVDMVFLVFAAFPYLS